MEKKPQWRAAITQAPASSRSPLHPLPTNALSLPPAPDNAKRKREKAGVSNRRSSTQSLANSSCCKTRKAAANGQSRPSNAAAHQRYGGQSLHSGSGENGSSAWATPRRSAHIARLVVANSERADDDAGDTPPMHKSSSPDLIEREKRTPGSFCFGAKASNRVRDRRKYKPRGLLTIEKAQICTDLTLQLSHSIPAPAVASVQWMVDANDDPAFVESVPIMASTLELCRMTFQGLSLSMAQPQNMEDGCRLQGFQCTLDDGGFKRSDPAEALGSKCGSTIQSDKVFSSLCTEASLSFPRGTVDFHKEPSQEDQSKWLLHPNSRTNSRRNILSHLARLENTNEEDTFHAGSFSDWWFMAGHSSNAPQNLCRRNGEALTDSPASNQREHFDSWETSLIDTGYTFGKSCSEAVCMPIAKSPCCSSFSYEEDSESQECHSFYAAATSWDCLHGAHHMCSCRRSSNADEEVRQRSTQVFSTATAGEISGKFADIGIESLGLHAENASGFQTACNESRHFGASGSGEATIREDRAAFIWSTNEGNSILRGLTVESSMSEDECSTSSVNKP